MTSLWHDRTDLPTSDPFVADGEFDAVIVGAGLTGMITAVLLARVGRLDPAVAHAGRQPQPAGQVVAGLGLGDLDDLPDVAEHREQLMKVHDRSFPLNRYA